MHKQAGFSLVGTIVGVTVFSIISFSVYAGFFRILNGIQILRVKNLAAAIANEQIEIVRNLSYENVGIVNGLPAGVIPREQTATRDGINFNIVASVRDVDDEYDGTIGGNPADLYAADYKVVQFDISCENCVFREEMEFFTRVAPKDLSVDGDGGALFVNVLNASGEPIQAANVFVYNDSGDNLIDIAEVTDIEGYFKIVNAPTGTEAYEIRVTKPGYSTEQTYQVGDPENPAPLEPHATVVTGKVAEYTFVIDEFSELDIDVTDEYCVAPELFDLNMRGEKEIGFETYKTNEVLNIEDGELTVADVEWDDYYFETADENLQIVGINQRIPFGIGPATSTNLKLVVAPIGTTSTDVLLKIIDSETGERVDGAEATLAFNEFSETIISGQYQYFGDDFIVTATSGEYLSETIDLVGTSDLKSFRIGTSSNPIETTEKVFDLQIATSDTNSTSTVWNFVGPDGTEQTFYEFTGEDLSDENDLGDIHDGNRYVRYRLVANRDNFVGDPEISGFELVYRHSCTPAGHVYFESISAETYEIEIKKDGYETYYSTDFEVESGWQIKEVILNRN